MRGKYLTFGYATDVGLIHKSNYDAYGCFVASIFQQGKDVDFGLFAVASGGGWGGEGDKAAAIAIRVIMQEVIGKIDIPILNSEPGQSDLYDLLRAGVEKANVEVLNGMTFDELFGSTLDGTTLTVALVVGRMAYIANAGDNRAYLFSNTPTHMEQITHDHTMVQVLVDKAHITPEEAQGHPMARVLYRYVGAETIDVDIYTHSLIPGAKLLLCSDGLWRQVRDNEIASVVTTNTHPQIVCGELIRLANANGGEDNVTVVVVEMPTANGLH